MESLNVTGTIPLQEPLTSDPVDKSTTSDPVDKSTEAFNKIQALIGQKNISNIPTIIKLFKSLTLSRHFDESRELLQDSALYKGLTKEKVWNIETQLNSIYQNIYEQHIDFDSLVE